MKKTLLTLSSVIFLHAAVHAQGYSFSHSNGTYAPLTGTTSLSDGAIWDDDVYTVPIGFDFTFGGVVYQEVDLDSNGYLEFDNGTDYKWIDVYFADLVDRGSTVSQSSIVTSLTGTPGNQIRKFEWVNAGFYTSNGPILTDFVNFQVWLHEADGKVETHIGPTTVLNAADAFDGEDGPSNGLATNVTSANFDGFFITGDPSAPTLETLVAATDWPFLGDAPGNGKIYTYTTGTVGVAGAVAQQKLEVFPNPCTENFTIRMAASAPATVNIFDSMGRLVSAQNFGPADAVVVNMANVPAGFYTVEMVQNSQRSTQKISKL